MSTHRNIHTFQAAADVASELAELQRQHPRMLGRVINQCLRVHLAPSAPAPVKPSGFPVTHRDDAPALGKRSRRAVYPWDQMKRAGDSFFVPGGRPNVIRASAYHQSKRIGGERVFVVRRAVEGGVDGARVWRTTP